jgi:hypothetical protein
MKGLVEMLALMDVLKDYSELKALRNRFAEFLEAAVEFGSESRIQECTQAVRSAEERMEILAGVVSQYEHNIMSELMEEAKENRDLLN